MRRPGRWRLSLRAKAAGQARIYQAQTQIFHQHGHGSRATAVVEQIAADQAAASSVFVGRDAQVDQLLDLIDPTGAGPKATVVSAVAGLAGVGKTTLASHVAQAAVGRGWFPGGAVWVDLRGYATDPADRVGPGQVFAPLLRALGVPVGGIPVGVDEQAAAYHQVLAGRAVAGRSVLVVLDNASTVDQLAGLLPAHAVHRALVTSRHTFGDLDGARIVELDVLDPGAAVDLVDQALRERDRVDARIGDHPDDARVLVERCGRLPLALRIAAALLADDPGMTVTGLAEELADTAGRLDTLAYGRRAVAAAFDLSWQHLRERDPDAARLFRLLPVDPGPDVSTETAAALADLPPARVRPLLRVLRRAHLIEPGAAPDRWGMHDLVHAYATSLTEEHTGERAAATTRLLDHYTTTVQAADDHLRALPGQPVPDRFTGRDQALSWFDAERANVTAAVTLAATIGDHETTVCLANCLAEYLSWRHYLDDWVTVATVARDDATHLDNPEPEGRAWNNLGMVLREVRRFDEAITAHHRARDIHQRAGDQRREGDAWNNLGLALVEVRRFDEAITAHRTAHDLYRQVGDRNREGVAWNNLGVVLREVRRFDEAITAHQAARDLYRQAGDQRREGDASNNLGLVLREVRRFDEAATALRAAGDLYRQVGDRHREGMAWNNLGSVLREVGRFDEAITAHQAARDLYRQTGDRNREGGAWNNLGLALAEVRRFDEAITAYQTAVGLHQQTGDRNREGMAWNNLGSALREVGRFDEAITAHQHDLEVCRQTGDRDGEGMAWSNLGLALVEVGGFDEAITAYQTAIGLHQRTGNGHSEGNAWNNLGLALAEVRRFDEAVTAMEHAVTAFTQTGAADDADDARRILRTIEETSGRTDSEDQPQP